MVISFAAVALAYMIVGNSMQHSLTGELQRLSAEKQQYEKEHVATQAELANLIQKNKNKLGLIEGRPGQLIRMN